MKRHDLHPKWGNNSPAETVPRATSTAGVASAIAEPEQAPVAARFASVAIVLVGIVGVILSPTNATPAHAATTTATTTAAVALSSVVVPSGGSQVISLGSLPSQTSAVTLTFTGSGAWQPTALTAQVSGAAAATAVFTLGNGDKPSKSMTLAVPAGSSGQLTLRSSAASVKVETVRNTVAQAALTTTTAPGTISLGAAPANTTAVVIRAQGAGAYRDTVVKAAVGSNPGTFVMTSTNNSNPVATATIPVPAGNPGRIIFSTAAANVRVSAEITGYVVSTTTPTPTPTPTPPPITGPAGADTTGVPAGTALTVHDGDLNISTPGAVVSGLDIRGFVYISADNVTIKNSIIRGRVGTKPLISNTNGYAGLKVIDSEIFPTNPTPDANGIFGYNFSLLRVDIHGVIDGMDITGNNVSVKDSWIHDLLHYDVDYHQGGSPSHDDAIQIQKGSNIVITGNNIYGGKSSAVQITQDSGVVSNVTFNNNIANGGACTINIAEKAYGPVRGVTIQDNTFGRDTKVLNCAIIAKTTTPVIQARNYYLPDNTLVTIKKG